MIQSTTRFWTRAVRAWPARWTASMRRGRWERTLAAPMRTTTASRPGVLSGLNAAIMETRSLGSILSEICEEQPLCQLEARTCISSLQPGEDLHSGLL